MSGKALHYTTNLESGKESARRVAQWLSALESTYDVYPVAVIIDNNAYFGARSTQILTPPPGARNPAPYERTSIYLLGRLHNTKDCGRFGYQPRRKFAYDYLGTLYGAGNGITEESITTDNRRFHPFGVWFDLTPYSADILRSDNGVEYPRKPIIIRAL